jgi:hypothetical protein
MFVSGVGKGTAAWNHCEVVTHGMVGSVIQETGRESREIARGSENCMNVRGNCVNENKSGEEVMNVKSLGLQDRL